LAQSEDEGDYATCDENYAHRGRQLFAIFRFHADFGVSEFHTVLFAVWNRDDKRQHSQHQQ
jgi:hypothetical protein